MDKIQFQLRNIFNALIELRQEFYLLDKEAENLNEIAMNAAVTAAQTGKSIRVFTEVSNQIVYSTKRMKGFIEENRQELNLILSINLKVLSNHSLDLKLSKAIEMISSDLNISYLNKKAKMIEARWRQDARKISSHIYPIKAILKSILQVQYRLFGAYNTIITESIFLDGSQKFAIVTLSETLYNSFESSISCLEKMFYIIKKINRLIKLL